MYRWERYKADGTLPERLRESARAPIEAWWIILPHLSVEETVRTAIDGADQEVSGISRSKIPSEMGNGL